MDKQKNQANIDRVDYYNVLRNKSDSVQSETESEKLVNNVPNDADERTKAFQEWVNSNMLLDSDSNSKISHKDAMKYEQKEELKKNIL